MHGGTEAARMDVFLADPGEDQLVPIGANQIEPHPAFPRCQEPSVDQVALVSCRSERIDEIGADFIAADTNRRADRHDKVCGVAAELMLHFLDCGHSNTCRGSAPAGMHRSDCTGSRVGDEQRHAIGGAHDERNIRSVRDKRITVRAFLMHGCERCKRKVRLDADDLPTVNLIQRGNAARLNVDRRSERAPRIRRR